MHGTAPAANTPFPGVDQNGEHIVHGKPAPQHNWATMPEIDPALAATFNPYEGSGGDERWVLAAKGAFSLGGTPSAANTASMGAGPEKWSGKERLRKFEIEHRNATETPSGPMSSGAGFDDGSYQGLERRRLTNHTVTAELPAHARYKGVSQPAGEAFLAAEPVLKAWRNNQPVDADQLTRAFDALTDQLEVSGRRQEHDPRAPNELVGIHSRLTWLSMAAARNDISLTARQSGQAFGSSLSLPIGENTTIGGRPMLTGPAQTTRYTITNQSYEPPLSPLQQRYLAESGGRWGTSETRLQNHTIASGYESSGGRVTGGAGRAPEEWIPGPGGGTKGGSFVDITIRTSTGTVRVQTVTTMADGKTPTPTEAAAAARIRLAFPSDQLILIPKVKK